MTFKSKLLRYFSRLTYIRDRVDWL